MKINAKPTDHTQIIATAAQRMQAARAAVRDAALAFTKGEPRADVAIANALRAIADAQTELARLSDRALDHTPDDAQKKPAPFHDEIEKMRPEISHDGPGWGWPGPAPGGLRVVANCTAGAVAAHAEDVKTAPVTVPLAAGTGTWRLDKGGVLRRFSRDASAVPMRSARRGRRS